MARSSVGLGGIDQVKELNDVVDLHVSWASEKSILDSKVWSAWTPEDPGLYYFDDKIEKTIDVCFLGTIHTEERQKYLSYLRQKNINIFISGRSKRKRTFYSRILRYNS